MRVCIEQSRPAAACAVWLRNMHKGTADVMTRHHMCAVAISWHLPPVVLCAHAPPACASIRPCQLPPPAKLCCCATLTAPRCLPTVTPLPASITSYEDKEVQRDKKLMSYSIVDKGGKPYVSVKVNNEDKVRPTCDYTLRARACAHSQTSSLWHIPALGAHARTRTVALCAVRAADCSSLGLACPQCCLLLSTRPGTLVPYAHVRARTQTSSQRRALSFLSFVTLE